MQAALLTLIFVAGTAPAPASSPVAGRSEIRPVDHRYVVPAAWPAVATHRHDWRRWPLPAEYFYRPFDYRYQFDYPWHARVRVVPGFSGGIMYDSGGPTAAPVAKPRLSPDALPAAPPAAVQVP